MHVTNIRITPSYHPGRVLAYCDVELDSMFLVRNIRLLSSDRDDGILVAFPQRLLVEPCGACGRLTPVVYPHCGRCGAFLGKRESVDMAGRGRAFTDVAHPIDAAARNWLVGEILAAYRAWERPAAAV